MHNPAPPSAGSPSSSPGGAFRAAPRQVRLLPLIALIFFSVSGGAYGIEGLFSSSGPGMGLLLIVLTPLIYGLPHSLVVAELGTAIPVEGGFYHWVKRGLGDFWGFQSAMLTWLCSFVDMALFPLLFANYLQSVVKAVAPGRHVLLSLGGLDIDLHWGVCVGVIVFFTLLNMMGAGWVGDSSLVFGVLCLTPMLALTGVGVWRLLSDPSNPVSSLTLGDGQSTSSAFGAGLFIVMWNYCGWDQVSTVAGEMANPRRDLPKALFSAMGLIVAGYLIPCLAALAVGPHGPAGWLNWEDGSFAEVGRVLGGPWLQTAVTIGGMFSAVAMFSALLASNSRLPLVLSRDGYLPSWLTKESRRFRAPVVSIIGSSAIYAVFCLSSFGDLVIVDVFLTNAVILLEVAALIALRVREPGLPRPYRVPGGRPALAAIVLSLASVCGFAAWAQYQDAGSRSVVYGLATVGFSCLLYVPLRWWRRSKVRRGTVADLTAGSSAYGEWLARAADRGACDAQTPAALPAREPAGL
ncbi:APC family permease [Streptomyces sp. NPDC048182]|uniref:APC family permease n=1 Tax=Streptomyces sp. NPDC048182 TaxID=3365507 RepID=UPI0037175CC9